MAACAELVHDLRHDTCNVCCCDAVEIEHLRAPVTAIPLDLYGLVHRSAPKGTVPRLGCTWIRAEASETMFRRDLRHPVRRLHRAGGLLMRISLFIVLLGWLASPVRASADDAAHAEMAAALAAQADVHPAPLALPVMAAAPVRAAPASAVKRGGIARSDGVGRSAASAANAADRASRNAGAQAAPQALAHQAQAAAAAAAGHAQSQRALHRHPR